MMTLDAQLALITSILYLVVVSTALVCIGILLRLG